MITGHTCDTMENDVMTIIVLSPPQNIHVTDKHTHRTINNLFSKFTISMHEMHHLMFYAYTTWRTIKCNLGYKSSAFPNKIQGDIKLFNVKRLYNILKCVCVCMQTIMFSLVLCNRIWTHTYICKYGVMMTVIELSWLFKLLL